VATVRKTNRIPRGVKHAAHGVTVGKTLHEGPALEPALLCAPQPSSAVSPKLYRRGRRGPRRRLIRSGKSLCATCGLRWLVGPHPAGLRATGLFTQFREPWGSCNFGLCSLAIFCQRCLLLHQLNGD
jgi:hypothetical protein